MHKLVSLFTAELRKKIWNSPLQLMCAGMLLYYLAMILGGGMACGVGNSDPTRSVFRCTYGEMSVMAKLAILLGIATASLCLGRAVSLLEQRRVDAD